MDDFNLNTIGQSRAEWCEQFIIIIKPYIMEGFDTIFNNAVKLSLERKMPNEYLKLFQQFIAQIPHWNQTLIETEKARIVEQSHCSYLEILLSATYIAQLKILSAIRAGTKSKKVDIEIPSLATFVHKIYTNAGREIYRNVYLYVRSTDKHPVSSLEIQKNRHKIDGLIREGIYTTFRTTIPIDKILKTYLEPTEEEEITVKTEEQMIYDNLPALSGGTTAATTTTATQSPDAAAAAAAHYTPMPPPPALEPSPAAAAFAMAGMTSTMLAPEPEPMPVMAEVAAEPSPTLVADDIIPDIFTPPTSDARLSFNNIDVLHDQHGIEPVEAPKDIGHLEELQQARAMRSDSVDTAEFDANVANAEEIQLPDLYDDEVI